MCKTKNETAIEHVSESRRAGGPRIAPPRAPEKRFLISTTFVSCRVTEYIARLMKSYVCGTGVSRGGPSSPCHSSEEMMGRTRGFICAMYMMAHIIQQQKTDAPKRRC